MKRSVDNFRSILVGMDYDTIESSPHSIFALSKDLKLIYFNEAWFEFAKQNNGEPNISVSFPLGTSIEQAISGDAKEFYLSKYREVLLNSKVWKHEYECSSNKMYRVFYQDVYPLKNREGIIVVNSLKVERLFTDKERKVSNLTNVGYSNDDGIIVQCTNCRKTQRPLETEIWDWIPSLVENMPKGVSHSICPICYDYFWKYRG
jgi:hypothetical protein